MASKLKKQKKIKTEKFKEQYQKNQFQQEIKGIIIIAIAIFLFLGLQYTSATGLVGEFIFNGLLKILFGQGCSVLPIFLGAVGVVMLFDRRITREQTRILGMLIGYTMYLIGLEVSSWETAGVIAKIVPLNAHQGGITGYFIAVSIQKLIGLPGVQIVVATGLLISLLLIFDVTVYGFLAFILNAIYRIVIKIITPKKKEEQKVVEKNVSKKHNDVVKEIFPEPEKIKKTSKAKDQSVITEKDLEDVNKEISEKIKQLSPNFQLPDIRLLSDIKISKDYLKKRSEEIKYTSQRLEDALESFKVEARVVHTCHGPTVTRYEIQPGPGVKVSKIVNLADDIALTLAAQGVRIEAPVPGKSVIGIEIPNKTTTVVKMSPLARDESFYYSDSDIIFALGKDIEGKPAFADLSKMPHLLVAGATGSGKSVCVNAIIISILLRNSPDSVRMIMIDPKKVELSVYDDIPHLIAPVVTDPRQAAVTLRWCVREMERRYDALALLGVRHLDGYNERIEELHKEREGLSEEDQKNFLIPQKLSYIMVIIDELADLMMIAASEVETSIARIAQMARAVGIHLIIATQRPSVDVITGLIKANVPSRISFAVSSQIDSRTILDGVGAEKLLGKGDMLYKPVGSMKATRVQGVYISDKEIHRIIKFVKDQGQPEYLQEVVNLKPEDLENMDADKGSENNDYDDFFEDARELVISTKKGSISFIQRKFRIGYNRAARIMEQLEESGVVTAPGVDGKTREVLG